MNTHLSLIYLTKDMPMKQIDVGGKPYLQRYFVGEDASGQTWLHRFLTADSERYLHSHPWTGTSMILCGNYTEQLRPVGAPDSGEWDRLRYLSSGDTNQITPQTVHRIVSVRPDTWTLLHIQPGREPTWAFVKDNGRKVVVQASSEDWHLGFRPRGQQ